jgi:L-alanine-DL-glutamate epimerase-like enolase superfamily enzyme
MPGTMHKSGRPQRTAHAGAPRGRRTEGRPALDALNVRAFTIPTDAPESDGTIEWSETTIVVVQASAGATKGLGYSYTTSAATRVITELLEGAVHGEDPMNIPLLWTRMVGKVRNAGRPGVCAMAISAVDNALWDLKARLLGLSLLDLLGAERESAPVYGSGGFTSYTNERLAEQLADWAEQGIPRVKMKIGRDPAHDPARVAGARRAIGDDSELFVDANGAFSARQAIGIAHRLNDESGVTWFEEPVSSDNIPGLRDVREHAPAQMEIAAGEYLWDPWAAAGFLSQSPVDCVQLDATRCCGITGYLRAAAAADAVQIPLSAHCAPQLHAHVACATPRLRHIEYFHDHVRIERMLFDGVLEPIDGCLRPDRSRGGMGLELKEADAEAYRVV